MGKPGSTSSLPKTDFASDYNEKGQLVGITHKVASAVLDTTYTYDDYGRLQNEKSELNGTTNSYKGWVYDELGRVAYTDFRVAQAGAPIVKTTYTYAAGVMPAVIGENKSNPTTSRVSGITLQSQHAGWSEAYTYTYDDAGNITGIAKDGSTIASYTYDAMNQLTAATQNGISYNVSYDRGGNILSKTASAGNSHTYAYSHAVWKDLLTAVDGNAITYDEIGNPLTYYDGTTFTWEGRQMQSATVGSTAISYTYNSDGYRTSKTVNGVKTIYVLDGSKVVMEQTGTGTPIYYTYDSAGKPTTMTVGSTTYYYIYNLQGDIIAITNNNGHKVVEYTYDPWGKLISTTGSLASSIGVQNPYRYRAYRYDTELEMYYLNSRYYDPEIGRFINADDVIAEAGSDVKLFNLFAYCLNNPVCFEDGTGQWPEWATTAIIATVAAAAAIAITVATLGAAAPAAACALTSIGMSIGMTYTAASAVAGAAVFTTVASASLYAGDIAFTMASGVSPMTETVFRGNREAYAEGFEFVRFATVGMIGAAALSPGVCFVAGTTIATEFGDEKIEDIKPGDLVWAWDEETGEVALKEVVQTFEKEATELVHIGVDGEEIVCTNEHPFYSPVKGWTAAGKLRAGDVLVTVNGEYVVVEWVQHEILESPIKVYNFEVTDFHTYYVSDVGVLVHNSCSHNSYEWRKNKSGYWKEQAALGGNDTWYPLTSGNMERMSQGKAPIGYDNLPVVLHHVVGIGNNMGNIVEIGWSEHIAFHVAYGYKSFIDIFLI